MEIRNLVTFLKVTELNSFSKAAEALDYSQSAVTVQIQQLERELGVRLFDRIGKNVSITQYGKNFISYARDIVSAVARAQVFASEETELTGMVQVGTLNSLMTASFSDIVPAFRQRFPHVMMRLHADMVASLKDKLLKNELDLIYTLDSQVLDPQKFDLDRLCQLLQARTEIFSQLPGMVDFLAEMPALDMALFTNKKSKSTPETSKTALEFVRPILDGIADWTEVSLHDTVMAAIPESGMKNATVLWPLRIAITGRAATPGGAFEMAYLLGKDETMKRLDDAMAKL